MYRSCLSHLPRLPFPTAPGLPGLRTSLSPAPHLCTRSTPYLCALPPFPVLCNPIYPPRRVADPQPPCSGGPRALGPCRCLGPGTPRKHLFSSSCSQRPRSRVWGSPGRPGTALTHLHLEPATHTSTRRTWYLVGAPYVPLVGGNIG